MEPRIPERAYVDVAPIDVVEIDADDLITLNALCLGNASIVCCDHRSCFSPVRAAYNYSTLGAAYSCSTLGAAYCCLICVDYCCLAH